MPTKPSNGRSIKGLLIRPGSQLKIFFFAAGLGQMVLSGMFLGYLFFMDATLPNSIQDSPEVLAGLQSSLFFMKAITVFLTVLILAASFASVTYFTHKVLGPCVPILRLIEKLKAGQYGEQGRLRKDDELKNAMQALNELSDELKKKAGK